jgi:hypothetical protein
LRRALACSRTARNSAAEFEAPHLAEVSEKSGIEVPEHKV